MAKMRYHDDQEIRLGDRVAVEMMGTWPEAVVVMLGATLEHLEIEAKSLDWYKNMGGVHEDDVVIQWLEGEEPMLGGYMSTCLYNVVLKSRSGG